MSVDCISRPHTGESQYGNGYELNIDTMLADEIPPDLLADSDALITPDDQLRLRTTTDRDTLGLYPYNSPAQLAILQNEKAAFRLGLAGAERLHTEVLSVLLAQKAMEGVVRLTSLEQADNLVGGAGHLWLKQEAEQEIGAYKIRGAFNKMRRLSPAQLKNGVITVSAGNHAQGVALSAELLGTEAVVVMPRDTPLVKVDGVRKYGATVLLKGNDFDQSKAWCEKYLDKNNRLTYISPYDDYDVITGQATIAAEILQQAEADISHIFVPVGGGGLISGIAQYINLVRPDTQIISVEPEGSDAMARSLEQNDRVELSNVDTFTDGVAVRQIGKIAFDLAREYVDASLVVSRVEIAKAMVDLNNEGMRTEPAGALALAGVRKYIRSTGDSKNFVAIRSGKNVDDTKLKEAYKLAGERRPH